MTDNLFPLRLQLLGQGYTPLPNSGKQTYLTNWPRVNVTEETIREWDTGKHRRDRSTGIRLDPPLAMIDLDCDSPAVMQRFWARAQRLAPRLLSTLERRRSNSGRRAWLLRTSEPFVRKMSHVWVDRDGHTAQLEIFGGGTSAKGGASRQMGAFGPHSPGSDYTWVGPSPLTVPPAELPVLTPEEFGELGDIFDEVMASRGWTMVGPKPSPTNGAAAFDLVESMRFHMQDGRTLSLQELSDEAEAHDGGESYLRCDARPFRPESDNRSVCSCTWHHERGLQIYDFSTAVSHYRAELDPERRIEELASLLPEPPTSDLFPPAAAQQQNAHDEAIAKLLREYALCGWSAAGQGRIVALTANGWHVFPECTLQSMATVLAGSDLHVAGPRGGTRRISPVQKWRDHPQRITVEGIRMRPDREFPVFEEGGLRWINSYAPPSHPIGEGSTGIWHDFMQHLFPVPSERRWLLQALAHKVQHPSVPGPAIVMVAEDYGSGRGTFYLILAKLFGERFVRSVGFGLVTGTSSQAKFNDWEAGALIVTIDEAATPQEDHSTLRSRRSMYENIKDVVDPSGSRQRKFEPKGKTAYWDKTFATYFIATNHKDALELPSTDRRFAVVDNGGAMSPALADRVYAWLERPENLGALYEELRHLRTDEFSPYQAPPMFTAKAAMIGASGSLLGEAIDEALSILRPTFMVHQVQAAINLHADVSALPANWHALVHLEVRHRFTRCGTHDTKFRIGTYRGAAYTHDRGGYNAQFAAGNETLILWVREALEENQRILRLENEN